MSYAINSKGEYLGVVEENDTRIHKYVPYHVDLPYDAIWSDELETWIRAYYIDEDGKPIEKGSTTEYSVVTREKPEVDGVMFDIEKNKWSFDQSKIVDVKEQLITEHFIDALDTISNNHLVIQNIVTLIDNVTLKQNILNVANSIQSATTTEEVDEQVVVLNTLLN